MIVVEVDCEEIRRRHNSVGSDCSAELYWKEVDGDETPVVRGMDSAIHWITQLVLLVFILWIVIYPVDSVIHFKQLRPEV